MEIIKKHTAIFIFTLSIALILTIYYYAFSAGSSSTLYLKDTRGDRSALADIVINGYLQDKYHAQDFEIAGGELHRRFVFYDSTEDIHSMPVKYGNGTVDDIDKYFWYSYDYKISRTPKIEDEVAGNKEQTQQADEPYSNDDGNRTIKETITVDKVAVYIEVYSRPYDKNSTDYGYIRFRTGVYYKSDNPRFIFERKTTYRNDFPASYQTKPADYAEFMMNKGAAIAIIDNRQYFTILSGKQCSGENGIYSVEKYEPIFNANSEYEQGHVKQIAAFSLDTNEIDVLGLHAVNGKLILVMKVDGVLTFRQYDPHTGKLDAELAVNEFKLSDEEVTYDTFTNGNVLSLRFIPQETISNGRTGRLQIVSVETGEELKLLNCVDNILFGNKVIYNLSCIASVNGKLVVVGVLQDRGSDKSYVQDTFLEPKVFAILVYDNIQNGNKLLYQGEIVCDANDDITCYRHKSPFDDSGISYYDIRHLANIMVRGK